MNTKTTMTWLDLYNFLHDQANKFENIGTFNWNNPVMMYDASTGEEAYCDTLVIDNDRVVLATNIESIFAENKEGRS